MRGVESKGMLAAASEIGLTDTEDGLMILPEDAEIGKPLASLYDSDTIIEVEVTPNRPRPSQPCRYGSRTGSADRPIAKEWPKAELQSAPAQDFIQLSAPSQCPYYTAVKIRDVKVAESPVWLKTKLEAIGLTPINNVVDITNYALHEWGHPLHAFDAAKVAGSLDIRLARQGETFLALDETEHELQAEDLVISDDQGNALALAGIMGGLESGVSDSTTDIILESAYFTPSFVRRTSR